MSRRTARVHALEPCTDRRISSSAAVTAVRRASRWTGKCWYIHEMVKYEFALEFELPVSYPVTPFEIVLPELDGKTVKMYRGGKICLSDHFKPLWAKNVPRFGIAHALAMGLGPWLAAEVPNLVQTGMLRDHVNGGGK